MAICKPSSSSNPFFEFSIHCYLQIGLHLSGFAFIWLVKSYSNYISEHCFWKKCWSFFSEWISNFNHWHFDLNFGISVLPDLHLRWKWLYCILREKCRDLRSFFWSVFSGVWTEYGYLSGDKCIQLEYRKITGEKKHYFRTIFTQWYMLILKILSFIVFSNIKKNVQATRKGLF